MGLLAFLVLACLKMVSMEVRFGSTHDSLSNLEKPNIPLTHPTATTATTAITATAATAATQGQLSPVNGRKMHMFTSPC